MELKELLCLISRSQLHQEAVEKLINILIFKIKIMKYNRDLKRLLKLTGVLETGAPYEVSGASTGCLIGCADRSRD